jgi:pyruvate/2-oxoglutarate dehydrogenase complex dihydrolipoamide dehydrogenase (E3) component
MAADYSQRRSRKRASTRRSSSATSEDVSAAVAQILREDGITILTDSGSHAVEQLGDGRITVTVRTPQGEQRLTGSHLLAAVGRVPNTERLAPQAAGIELDGEGHVQVNERLETTTPGIYALGDVKGGPAFTRITYDDVRILLANLLEHGSASTHDRIVPYTIFIDRQLARVGLSETEAWRQGRHFRVAKLPMSAVPRAIETGETRAFMKAIVDADTRQILGCATLGLDGGEIMTIVHVAMMGKLPYTALAGATLTHPTLAEGLNALFCRSMRERTQTSRQREYTT